MKSGFNVVHRKMFFWWTCLAGVVIASTAPRVREAHGASMGIYRNVPLSGAVAVVEAIWWSGQGLITNDVQRSQMIFSNAISKGPWQPAGYAGQPLSGVTVAGPAGTVLSLQPQTLGPTGAFDDLRLQEPNSMPGPYSITGLVLFNKTSFANVLSTDQVVLSPTNIFAGLFADVAPAAGDTSGIRWVVEDGTNFFISTASTGLASATNPSSISQNPTSLAWYGYDPLTDITAIGAMVRRVSPTSTMLDFVLKGLAQRTPPAHWASPPRNCGLMSRWRFRCQPGWCRCHWIKRASPTACSMSQSLPILRTTVEPRMRTWPSKMRLTMPTPRTSSSFFPRALSLHGRFVLHSNSRSCLARPAQICQQVGRFDPGPATGAETCRWRGRDQYHRSGRRAFATGLPGLCPVFVGGRRGQFRDPRRPGIAILLHVPGNRY